MVALGKYKEDWGKEASTISGMRMRTLGGTGIKVSSYCLGAMMFGAWGNTDHEDSIRIIHAALDGGINFIDTADVYSAGESEEIVGKALHGRRDNVVLATKANAPMSDDVNMRGNSRRWSVGGAERRHPGSDRPDRAPGHDSELPGGRRLAGAGAVGPRRPPSSRE
jgi:hypothetical protein